MIIFHEYSSSLHRNDFIEMNTTYLSWIRDECLRHFNIDLLEIVGPIDEYIKKSLPLFESFHPPDSIVYILIDNDMVAGMGSIKKTNNEFSEIKRMFIKPEFRGKGLGKSLLNKLMDTARQFSVQKLRLDTGPFMKAAQKLYQDVGFHEIEKYPDAEGPENPKFTWIYMEKILT